MSPRIPMLVIAACYLIACALPALDFGPSRQPPVGYMSGVSRGIECLIGPPLLMIFPPWWANVFLAGGLVAVVERRRKLAIWLGVVAVVLAASTAPVMGARVLAGYFVWQGCMVGLLILACYVRSESRPADRKSLGRDDEPEQ